MSALAILGREIRGRTFEPPFSDIQCLLAGARSRQGREGAKRTLDGEDLRVFDTVGYLVLRRQYQCGGLHECAAAGFIGCGAIRHDDV
jgi:hypothetical protein